RLDALMKGEVEGTTLTEPHITLAEKKGCRAICTAFFHGTEVASERVDAETYAAFNRAVREAVRRINANKRAYLHYFIDYYAKSDPEIAALKVEDLRESRLVVCDPAPIPLEEMQRTYDGPKSWGMLEDPAPPLDLVNMDVQRQAHHQAAECRPPRPHPSRRTHADSTLRRAAGRRAPRNDGEADSGHLENIACATDTRSTN